MTYYLTTTARHKGAKRQIQRRARDIGTLKRTATFAMSHSIVDIYTSNWERVSIMDSRGKWQDA
jgi:hypothetical protein